MWQKIKWRKKNQEADLTLDDLSDEACEHTYHELHCKTSVKGWAEHWKKLLSVLTESAACRLVSYVHVKYPEYHTI